MLTSSSALFNQLSNGGLQSQGFIFTLAVIMPAPLCSCLHSRNHTHITSAKCSLCVCVLQLECVGGGEGVEGVEGVEYLPSGYDKVTEGRQWSPKQWRTCQSRTGLTAQHGRTESVVPVLAFLDRLHLTVIWISLVVELKGHLHGLASKYQLHKAVGALVCQ